MSSLERLWAEGCLKELAFDPANSAGRRCNEEKLYPDDPFIEDINSILTSRGMSRAPHLTQVFTLPTNHFVQNRFSHTMRVVTTTRKLCRRLGLNEALGLAGANGHDVLGHPPFGHLTEHKFGLDHAILGAINAQHIENEGQGLNLSFETLLVIAKHSSGSNGLVIDHDLPLEVGCVRIADKMAYTIWDPPDMVRYGLPEANAIVKILSQLGPTSEAQTERCISAVVTSSAQSGTLSFQSAEFDIIEEARRLAYETVYYPLNDGAERQGHAKALRAVHAFLGNSPIFEGCDPTLVLVQMTDKEVISVSKMLRRKGEPAEEDLIGMGFKEIIPFIRGKQIDLNDPDLDWGMRPTTAKS